MSKHIEKLKKQLIEISEVVNSFQIRICTGEGLLIDYWMQ